MTASSIPNHPIWLPLSGVLLRASASLASGASTDAWPGDSYTGPLTPVSGTLGGTEQVLFAYGDYPTPGSVWRYRTDFTPATLAQFIAEKRRLDPAERFTSHWYRSVCRAWRGAPCRVRFAKS